MDLTASPPDADVTISADYVHRLVVKVRAVQAREGLTDPQSGSNGVDDGMVDALQVDAHDLRLEEVRKEIDGLDEHRQSELVALMWIGRGDAEPEDWAETVHQATQSRVSPTASYVLGDPLAGDYLAEGLVRMGLASGLAPDV